MKYQMVKNIKIGVCRIPLFTTQNVNILRQNDTFLPPVQLFDGIFHLFVSTIVTNIALKDAARIENLSSNEEFGQMQSHILILR